MGRDSMNRSRGGVLVWVVATLAWAGPSRPAVGQETGAQGGGAAVASTTAPRRGAEPGPRLSFLVAPADADISVDGRLDEAGWDGAAVIPLPFEVNPGENVAAPVDTECRVTYDRERLYLGCVAHDPDPEAIRAYIVDRDGIGGHDQIILTLDPFNDQRRAFQFGVSALGVQFDAVLAQQGVGGPNQGAGEPAVDPSWDAIWASAGTIDGDGYVVEASIPFQSLRFPATEGVATWGLYLSRIWPRSSAVETRSATWDRDNSCILCQANELTGLQGIHPGGTLQLTPTLTAGRSDAVGTAPDVGLQAGSVTREVGLDAVWGVTSDVTVNLTVNPDFSQVEADVAQLDVNNRFALFYPERRPFFLEGADFFGTPIQAVFTRSISNPTAGAKLSGKVGANALGFLLARDRSNNLLIPGSQSSTITTLDAEVTTAVARIRRDLAGTSTVGGLFTSRQGAGYHNHVGGVDAFFRPLPSLTIQAQALRSQTRYPAEVSERYGQTEGGFTGDAVQAQANWASRSWLFNSEFTRVSSGFRADAGFVNQAGVRGGFANAVRRFLGDSAGWFTEFRIVSGVWRNEDFEGNRLNGGMWLGVVYRGPMQSSLGIWPNFAMKEHYAGTTFEGLRTVYFSGGIQPSGAVGLNLNGEVGNVVDYANAQVAKQVRVSPGIELRLGRNVEANVQHTLQRLTRDGDEVLTANLTQVRGVYNFSARSLLRGVVQYQRTDRNQGSYAEAVDPRSSSLFAQILYAYKVNPQTVLFVGYSEGRNGLLDHTGVDTPLTTTGRTFFLKLGYAFRP